MKSVLILLLALTFSPAAFGAADPTVKFDLLIDGSITNPATHTVSGYLSTPETIELQLSAKPLGSIVGVSHIWTGSIKKTAKIDKYPVVVTVLVSKFENKDGTIHFWSQVMFGNKIASGVGVEALPKLRQMAMGAPQDLDNNLILEPRAILDFK